MPRCSKCHLDKPLTDFVKNRSHASGHNCECKACDITNTYRAHFALHGPSMEPQRCAQCRLTKPATEFDVVPKNKSGRHPWCKSCRRTKGKHRYYTTSGRKHRPPLHIRFWSHVDCSGGPDACWPWEGLVDKGGYGICKNLSIGKTTKAHRVAWMITFGDIPTGMSILHSCDHRSCVNIFKHLRLGTQAENMQEASLRQRMPGSKKPNNPAPIAVSKQHFTRNAGKPSWEERFWAKVDRSLGNDACWLWIAGTSGGYGMFTISKHRDRAHRISFRIHCGPIPDGMLVCHRCDQPLCVNPTHLFLGTISDNAQDKIHKARHPHIITQAQALYILSSRGIIPSSVLAAEFGVTRSAISQIWNGRTHKCLSNY